MKSRLKAKRLVLHAGLPKTATTSIQNAIFKTRGLIFSETRVYYPGSEANHTNALCTAFLTDPSNHISNKIHPTEGLENRAAKLREGFSQEIREVEPETILFSAEGMSNLSAIELARFRDWALTIADAVEVLYIVRNPLHYTTSVMQQHLKGGDVLEEMYIDPPLANFQGRIGAAISVFGRSAVRVRTFEDMTSYTEGPTGFFLDCIGLTEGCARAAAIEAQSVDNESLSHEAALILSSLNRRRPAFVNGSRGSLRTLNELEQIQTISGRKFFLPHDVSRRIMEASRADVVWLKNMFGIDAYDDLEITSRYNEAQVDRSADCLPPETIDSIAVLLSNLINDRHVNGLLQRARALYESGDFHELAHIAAEVRRILPSRQLPKFLD